MGIPSVSVDPCFGKGWSIDLTSFTKSRTSCKYRIYKVHNTPLMYDASNFIKKGRGIRFVWIWTVYGKPMLPLVNCCIPIQVLTNMMFDHLLEDYSRTAANLADLQFFRLSFFSVLSCSFLSFTNSSLVAMVILPFLEKINIKYFHYPLLSIYAFLFTQTYSFVFLGFGHLLQNPAHSAL